tara:strand:+ start:2006 stop:2953 length:948 start_codon:yes stop_codon:yes gene_type:complete
VKAGILYVLSAVMFFACSGGNSLVTIEMGGQRTEVASKVSKGDSVVTGITSFHENSEISVLRPHKKGVPHGKWTWFGESGSRDTVRIYKDSLLSGKSRGWHANGELLFEQIFKEGKKVGIWRVWFDDGTLRSIAKYDDDFLDGAVAEWFTNGVLFQLREYSDGKKDGTVSQWSPKGRLIRHSVFIQDIPHIEIQWHDSGELRMITAYREGEEAWQIGWDMHGRRISKPLHEKHEVFRERNKLGHRKVESDFIAGKKHGVELQWHDNGKIAVVQCYVRNRIIYERSTDEKGRFKWEIVSIKGEPLWSRKKQAKIPS